jgi:hypothetical protein
MWSENEPGEALITSKLGAFQVSFRGREQRSMRTLMVSETKPGRLKPVLRHD